MKKPVSQRGSASRGTAAPRPSATSVARAALPGKAGANQQNQRAPNLPWNIPTPKGIRPVINADVDAETTRFSGGVSTAQQAKQRRVHEGSLSAAQLRQQGRRLDVEEAEGEQEAEQEPDEQELDQLGDAQYDEPAAEEDEQEFLPENNPLPPAFVPRAPKATPRAGLTLLPIQIEDTDRLWDWIRQDGDRGAAFFAKPLANSMELHDLMKGLLVAEAQGQAVVRSIHWQDAKGSQHLGSLMLVPILAVERVALMHIYLAPAVRHGLPQLAQALVQQAIRLVPGYHLAVFSLGEEWRQLHRSLLGPLGFAEHTLFVR